jgi:broad specificity phosphatase PhoE
MLQYLIRHGQSLSNLAGRVQGREDVELSALGRAQALRVAMRLAAIDASAGGIAEIWSSPLVRARDTALPIADRLGLGLQTLDTLCELHAGIFQGHLWADLESRFPDEVARWRSGDVDYAIPGGESRAQLATRGAAALTALAERPAAAVVVVAHGGVLTAALGRLVGRAHPLLAAVAERPFTKLPALDNGSVTILSWPGPELVSFNDTIHLADLTEPQAGA